MSTTKTTSTFNPLNISYFEQAKRFGLGFAITSFFGDLDTAMTISATDHMLEKLNKEMDKKEEKAKKEATKTDTKSETKTEEIKSEVTKEEAATETKTEEVKAEGFEPTKADGSHLCLLKSKEPPS